MNNDLIRFLDGWYKAQCDGEWENAYAVRISNVSNPGWILTVDLVGTALEGRVLDDWTPTDALDDWLYCHSDGATFEAMSSVPGLARVIDAFRLFVGGQIGRDEDPGDHRPEHQDDPFPSAEKIKYFELD